MKLAIATNNKHKLSEIRQILGDNFSELLSLDDLNVYIDIEETGTTLLENAIIKARTITHLTGLTSIADDSGLMVDALDGAPGVFSARYAGDEHNDAQNNAFLLKNLENLPRTAHFCSVIVVYYPDGTFLTAEGKVNGEILFEEKGTYGFGYDPLFYSYELKKTFAEASSEEKNKVSHRGRALRNMLTLLQD